MLSHQYQLAGVVVGIAGAVAVPVRFLGVIAPEIKEVSDACPILGVVNLEELVDRLLCSQCELVVSVSSSGRLCAPVILSHHNFLNVITNRV